MKTAQDSDTSILRQRLKRGCSVPRSLARPTESTKGVSGEVKPGKSISLPDSSSPAASGNSASCGHLSLLPPHSVRAATGTQLGVWPLLRTLPRPWMFGPRRLLGGWVGGGWSPPQGASSQPRQSLGPIPTVPHKRLLPAPTQKRALPTCRILLHLQPRPFAPSRTGHAPPPVTPAPPALALESRQIH